MLTSIYKNGNEVCRVEHSSKMMFYIEGTEKSKFEKIILRSKGRYVWEILVDFMDEGNEYTIKTP